MGPAELAPLDLPLMTLAIAWHGVRNRDCPDTLDCPIRYEPFTVEQGELRSMRTHLNFLEPRLLTSLLFCGALLTPTSAAQESARVESSASQESEEPAELERSTRRILHFTRGGTQTAVARFVENRWEVKDRNGKWQAYPEGSVTRAPKEIDVQREMKKRTKVAHESPDLDSRVKLARWMVSEGLVSDALREADELLALDPHHEATLAFLTESRLLVTPSLDGTGEELKAQREELYRWASKSPSSVREIAIHELRKSEDSAAVQAELLAGLGNFSVRRRAFCAQALGRLYPGDQAKRLLQHAVLDKSQDVRRQAAHALGNADEPGLIVPVVRALGSTNIRVRTQAAEALGNMDYAEAVEPLVSYIAVAQSSGTNRVPHGYIFVGKQTAYIQDFDVEVATFQAVADPQINVLLEGDVLEAGVSGVLEYSYAVESRAARASLGRLTGADPGNTGRSWQRWWNENQNEWKAGETNQSGQASGL